MIRRIFTFGRTEPAVEQWTVLWHAIPEDRRVSRSRFASRLRFLGFGSVQDATWVAARNREHEVRLLLHELDIRPYVSVMVGHVPAEVPPVALVAQAWRLDEVGKRYEAFLSAFGGFRKASARRSLSAADAFKSRTLLLHRFRSFPAIDPELSEGIDTVRDLRRQAVECFDEVYATLEEKAAEHFWETVEPRSVVPVGT